MALNGLLCADIVLRSYSLTVHLLARIFMELAADMAMALYSLKHKQHDRVLSRAYTYMPCYIVTGNNRCASSNPYLSECNCLFSAVYFTQSPNFTKDHLWLFEMSCSQTDKQYLPPPVVETGRHPFIGLFFQDSLGKPAPERLNHSGFY